MKFNLSMLEAPVVSGFRGRSEQLAQLHKSAASTTCKIVTVLGLGGMGKSWLARVFVDQVEDEFAEAVWIPLLNAPDWETTARNVLRTLDPNASLDFGTSQELLGQLYERLGQQRYLLVLDNFETLMEPQGSNTGKLRAEHQGYEQLLRVLALGMKGHTVLTSRERPDALQALGDAAATINITGLSVAEAAELEARRQVEGTDAEWAELVRLYGGNPQLLRLAVASVAALGGSLRTFLSQRSGQLVGEHDLFAWHFDRLSHRERSTLYWLSVRRAPTAMKEVGEWLFPPPSPGEPGALDVLTALRSRDIVEWSPPDVLSLQPALLEYVTHRLVTQAVDELAETRVGIGTVLTEQALLLTNSSAAVRSSVRQLILQPVLKRLALRIGGAKDAGAQLHHYLGRLRDNPAGRQGYAAGNVCNLLASMDTEIRNLDLSGLVVRHAYLSDTRLIDSSFAGSELVDCETAQTFGNILTVAADGNGEWFAAAGTDNDVRVWSRQGLQYATFIGHTNWVRALSFDPTGTMLATTSSDGSVRVWDMEQRSLLWMVEAHTMRIWGLTWTRGRIVTASQDGTMKSWDATTGRGLVSMTGHSAPVLAVAPLGDRMVVSGSADGTVRVWQLDDGMQVSRLDCGFEVTTLATHRGRVLIGGSTGRIVIVQDQEGQLVEPSVLREEGSPVNAVTLSPDGSVAASAHDDGSILIWDLTAQGLLTQLDGHSTRTTSLAFGSGEHLLSGGEDQKVRRWDTSRWQLQDVLVGKANHAWSLALATAVEGMRSETVLLSAHEDASLRLWSSQDDATWIMEKELRGHTNRIWSVRASRTRPWAVSASEDGHARVWDLTTGTATAVLGDHLSAVWAADFTHDNQTIVTGTHDGRLRTWDVAGDMCRAEVQAHHNRIRAVECHPARDIVVSGGEDNVIRVWTTSLLPLAEFDLHRDRINALSFNGDGSILASGGRDGQIIIWDFDTRQMRASVTVDQFVWAVALSPDGDMVAYGTEDGEVHISSWRGEGPSPPLCRHQHRVKSLTFSQDGQLLLSCSEEGAIRAIDVARRDVVSEIHAPRSYEGLDISGLRGLSAAGIATLEALGARRQVAGGRETQQASPIESVARNRHVFISYSRRDVEYANRLVAELNAAGIPVWRDAEHVEHGSAFVGNIESALNDSVAVVAIMSPHAATSRWVRRELQHADAAEIPVLPLLLDGAPLFQLGDLHFEDVRGGHSPGRSFFDRLLNLLLAARSDSSSTPN